MKNCTYNIHTTKAVISAGHDSIITVVVGILKFEKIAIVSHLIKLNWLTETAVGIVVIFNAFAKYRIH